MLRGHGRVGEGPCGLHGWCRENVAMEVGWGGGDAGGLVERPWLEENRRCIHGGSSGWGN
jgi:hypothetical protein